MRIICPKCGEVEKYGIQEKIVHILIFDSTGECVDATEDRCIYSGKVPHCLNCNRKVKIEEEIEES